MNCEDADVFMEQLRRRDAQIELLDNAGKQLRKDYEQLEQRNAELRAKLQECEAARDSAREECDRLFVEVGDLTEKINVQG